MANSVIHRHRSVAISEEPPRFGHYANICAFPSLDSEAQGLRRSKQCHFSWIVTGLSSQIATPKSDTQSTLDALSLYTSLGVAITEIRGRWPHYYELGWSDVGFCIAGCSAISAMSLSMDTVEPKFPKSDTQKQPPGAFWTQRTQFL